MPSASNASGRLALRRFKQHTIWSSVHPTPGWRWDGYPHTFIMEELIRVIMHRQARRFSRVFALEVGSFSGGSAIKIVKEARNMQLPPEQFCLMCLDTWLGDVNMIANIFDTGEPSSYRDWLRWDAFHQPHIMQAFCGNLHAAGAAPSVVPLRASSLVGMRVLERFATLRGLTRPSVLYLDSAHEPLETLLELGAAWQLIAPDGIIFGDDYYWEAVALDVRRFAFLHGLTVHLYEGQWMLHKPAGPPAAAAAAAVGAGSAAGVAGGRVLQLNGDLTVSTDVDPHVQTVEHLSLDSLREAVSRF